MSHLKILGSRFKTRLNRHLRRPSTWSKAWGLIVDNPITLLIQVMMRLLWEQTSNFNQWGHENLSMWSQFKCSNIRTRQQSEINWSLIDWSNVAIDSEVQEAANHRWWPIDLWLLKMEMRWDQDWTGYWLTDDPAAIKYDIYGGFSSVSCAKSLELERHLIRKSGQILLLI